MNFETALSFVNSIIDSNDQRKLRSPEITIFQGTWQGLTYEQMADSSPYSANYLMRDIGPKFWKFLSNILRENIGKSNLRVVIERLYTSSQNLPEQFREIDNVQQTELQHHQQDASNFVWQFYGRKDELTKLRQWTTVDKRRLIGLWGLSGVGKTVLMKKLADNLFGKFDTVIWRSLIEAPTLEELIGDLLQQGFSGQERSNSLAQLIKVMRAHSCLILLDDIETILQPEEFSGRYRSGYENYEKMFRLIGESSHQSCMMLSGLERPGGIFQLEQHGSPIRSLKLSGLSKSDARLLLQQEGLTPSANWQSLIEYYQANPAMLSIASKTIGELFNGNVEEFLAQTSLVFGKIDRLLDKSLKRLSVLERDILYWLVSESEPVSLTEIQNSIPLSFYPGKLLEALESINERSLIEISILENHSVFVVPPIIRELVTNRYIAQIGQFTLQNGQRRVFSEQAAIELNLSARKPTHLRRWLQNSFESDWQPIEVIFAASARSPARLRSAFNLRDEALVKRFKQIKLATTEPTKVLLLVAIGQEEQAFKICVQAQPVPGQQTLPENLCLRLEGTTNKILAEIESGTQDNFIQLPYFRGIEDERFKIVVVLNSASHEEQFVI